MKRYTGLITAILFLVFTQAQAGEISGPESDPIAMPILINLTGDVNSLETKFNNYTSAFTSMTTIFGDYSATNNMNQILCDATAGARDIHIVSAVGTKGRISNVKKIDSSGNSCCIEPAGSETIDGIATRCISTQWENLTFFSDDTNLLIR